MHPEGEGYRSTLQLLPNAFNASPVGKQVQKSLSSFMRASLRTSGWSVRSFSFHRGYVELVIAPSRAASRELKNLSTKA